MIPKIEIGADIDKRTIEIIFRIRILFSLYIILYAEYPITPPITLVIRSKNEKPPIIVASCISSIDSDITKDTKNVFNILFSF